MTFIILISEFQSTLLVATVGECVNLAVVAEEQVERVLPLFI